MGAKSVVGMEVPYVSNDCVNWIEASVPNNAHLSSSNPNSVTLATEDYASSLVIGTPPIFLTWRIKRRLPHAIELLQFHGDKEIPRVGLRVLFPEELSPFVSVCKNEINPGPGSIYLLYALSVSGIAYLLSLKDISDYGASFVFSSNELLHFNTNISRGCSPITCATATSGCLVIGRCDGSVSCFRLGAVDEHDLGFTYELKDEAALNRLLRLMSRSRFEGGVEDLVISNVNGRKVLFVLKSDGSLQIWDLFRHGKLFSQSLSAPGVALARLWVGPVGGDISSIPLAISYKQFRDTDVQGINVYKLSFPPGQRHSLSLETSELCIPFSEGKLIDVKFSSDKIWVLKEDGLLVWDMVSLNIDWEEGRSYRMQEAFIAEQLFQSSEHSAEDLYQTACSIFSPSQAQIVGFLSSIFLRRVFHPEVYNGSVLRLTLEDYDKRWPDNEFQALTIDDLKREILLLIEHEAVGGSPFSAFKCWKDFCSRYFDWWCKTNAPFGLIADSANGVLGLMRENAVSLFRSLEAIEQLTYGSCEKLEDLGVLGFDTSSNNLECEILFEALRCTKLLSRRLGPAVTPIWYESAVGMSVISPQDIVPRLLKTLGCGCNTSVAALNVSYFGADIIWQKELSDHKSLRKFSMDILVSLHSLCEKAGGWERVLDVIMNYLNILVPRKPMAKLDSDATVGDSISITVHATSQIAEKMCMAALDVLLFLSYILNICGQVKMLPDDMSKIQLELIPIIEEIISEWLIIHFLTTMPSKSLSAEDFSSQLSSLKLDSSNGKRSWTEKIGCVNFTLATLLSLDAQDSSEGWISEPFSSLPNPECFIKLTRQLSRWIIWGRSCETSFTVFGHSLELALSLLKHGQYEAVQILLQIIDKHLGNEKLSSSIQSNDGEWCVLHHLLGCCLLAQVQRGPPGSSNQKKASEAMRSFFRASSGEGAPLALLKLPKEAGLSHLKISECVSSAAWKLQYYQWVMQKFEQYSISDAACQFALAALEQVDEAVVPNSSESVVFLTDESAVSLKGRLWANVFKFALDLDQYYDAYCAIISNPDDESKNICLRRFLIVLYERGATKMLRNSHLPFIGLFEKAEQELAWKAACSDLSARPHPYKLLYAFEMDKQNWRRAASYIYLYSIQVKNEMHARVYQNTSHALQERLNGISAAINCLHLVHPMYAWINRQITGSQSSTSHPSKRARTMEEQCKVDHLGQIQDSYIGIENLEDEFVLTSAEYILSLANVKWTHTGNQKLPSDLVDLLVEAKLYDIAFTVALRFWKDSQLKRELERVFSAMASRCLPSKVSSPMDDGSPGLLLTYSMDETMTEVPFDVDSQSKVQEGTIWEILEQYLEKYKGFHGRLPTVVAETLLRSDPHIELPLWLVEMFKGTRGGHAGMSGEESDPATLFRLYVDYGRFPEASELLVEYIDAYASVRPPGMIHRKKPAATWFPYTAIERLWCHLEQSIRAGHMTEQSEKLKEILHGALRSHLILLKTDSEDAICSAIP